MTDLDRVTLRVPEDLLEDLDDVADRRHGGNRSAAVRNALETLLAGEAIADGGETPDDVSCRQAAAWESVGHRAVWMLFATARGDLQDALYPIEATIKEDRAVDETAVRKARRELDHLRSVLEDYVVPLADDVEQWDDGAGATTPYGVFREELEDAGYDVTRPGEDDE